MDYSYFTPVAVGSAEKIMYLAVDTGATVPWVMGSNCISEACGVHHTFGQADSTSLKPANANFTVGYGSGMVSGELVNDTVRMGELSLLTTFGLATEVSDAFLRLPIDGIFALSRPNSSNFGYTTVMETLIQSNVLEANVIGINLQRASDGTADGELNFGAPDTTKYSGDLSYVDTVSESMAWEISIDDIVVNGVACNFTGRTAFIDTGSSYTFFPLEDAKQVHDLIPQSRRDDGGEMFQLPCSTDVLVQVIISGTSYDIRSEDIVGLPITGSNNCESKMVAKLESPGNKWILGDVFLKNVYTVLDFDKDMIGWSPSSADVEARLTWSRFWCQGFSNILKAKSDCF